MNCKLTFNQAQHLCALVSRFFDAIAETSPEYGEEVYARPGDFAALVRDFTHEPEELTAAGEIDAELTALARKILGA